jgi:hypothetical protein
LWGKGSAAFFKKSLTGRQTKTFAPGSGLGTWARENSPLVSAGRGCCRRPQEQKFFGSFFQKRTAFFGSFVVRRRGAVGKAWMPAFAGMTF